MMTRGKEEELAADPGPERSSQLKLTSVPERDVSRVFIQTGVLWSWV